MESKPRIKFSLLEKMEFYDDKEIKLFYKIFNKIEMDSLKQYIELSIKDMSDEISVNDDEEENTEINFSMEALAVRKLMEILHRESLHCDREEIIEYLNSLNLKPAVCDEIATLVMSRDIFNNIPKSLRIRPTIKSMHWMIDLSYYQRISKQSTDCNDKNNLGNMLRILLFIRLSDGRKRSMYLKCGKESWLRYSVRMASNALARVDAASQQNIERDEEEND